MSEPADPILAMREVLAASLGAEPDAIAVVRRQLVDLDKVARWADRLFPLEEPPPRYPLPPFIARREGK